VVPLIEKGKAALIEINRAMGLGLDDWDIDYYYNHSLMLSSETDKTWNAFDLSQSTASILVTVLRRPTHHRRRCGD